MAGDPMENCGYYGQPPCFQPKCEYCPYKSQCKNYININPFTPGTSPSTTPYWEIGDPFPNLYTIT